MADAQLAIGTSSNIAQLAQTYMYNFKEQKYIDYVCILSTIAQISIDSAKRTFDIDLVSEIDRIKKDMNTSENLYPSFWKHVKDKKAKIGDNKFSENKINKNLVCPMNYLMDLKFKKTRSKESTLPMNYFFNKFELKADRRKNKKVEELIENYSIVLRDFQVDETLQDFDCILMCDYDKLLDDIKSVYLSNDYLGLTSWLIDRAFCITPNVKNNRNNLQNYTNKNKSLLLKLLYDINPNNVI